MMLDQAHYKARRLDPGSRCTGLRNRRAAARGFSLIEVMIATGIFAMMAGLLFSALWSGQAQVARLSRTSSEDEQLLTARRILKSWIETATVAGVSQEDGAPVFRGQSDLMVFNATPAGREGLTGLYRIELSIRNDDGSAVPVSRLVIKRQRLDVLAGTTSGPVESAQLLALARPLMFAYGDELGTGIGGQGQLWTQHWPQSDRLPTRVQLHDGRAAVLNVTLAVSKDPRCVLNRGPDTMVGGECLVR